MSNSVFQIDTPPPVAVEDDGYELTNAATLLNFAGDGVSVTEPVIDEMLVTIPGADLQTVYGASEGSSSTTSTTYQQKLRVSITPDATGDFLVMWSAAMMGDQTERFVIYRVQQDDTTTLADRWVEQAKNADQGGEWFEISGFKVVTLTASTTYDFDLDYARAPHDMPPTAYIKEARILIRRMMD